jgi:hypothetical protein
MKRSWLKSILNQAGEGLMWLGWMSAPIIWDGSHDGSRDEDSRETQS